MLLKLIVVFVLLSALQADVYGQSLTPNVFTLVESSVGKPQSFTVSFRTTRDYPITFVGLRSTGTGDVLTDWSSNYPFGNSIEGRSIQYGTTIFLSFVPRNAGPIDLQCEMEFIDNNGNHFFAAPYSVSCAGSLTSTLTTSLPSIEFGDVEKGSEATASIVVRNAGPGVAYIRGRGVSKSPFQFLSLYAVVNAGDSTNVQVLISPRIEGEYTDTLTIEYTHIPALNPLTVPVHATCIYPTAGLYAESASFSIWPPHSYESTQSIEFTTTWPEVEVIGITLRQGLEFYVTQQPLPVFVRPASPLRVEVTWSPNQTTTFQDTLVVTTRQGKAFAVELHGYIAVDVADDAPRCVLHPNPSTGSVTWCGHPRTPWHVINSVGERVATITSDEQGACSWSTSTSGMYTIVSQRGEPAMRVVIVQ